MARSRRTPTQWNHRFAALLVAVGTALLADSATGGIAVNVTRVGFPSLGATDVIRSGAWTPVVVDLELVGQKEFFGSVRVGQRDVDGDECYDSVNVHLREESGGSQRVMLYALANPNAARAGRRFAVEVFDADGNQVPLLTQSDVASPPPGAEIYQALPAQVSEIISDDEILILSISTGAMGRIQDLLTLDSGRVYARRIRLGHMSPAELPELWVGLEMVDHIVWDDPHPETLTERQVEALVEWVNQGGTLVLAASRSVGSLQMAAPLRGALPVEIGEVVSVENLPELRRTLLDKPTAEGDERINERWWSEPFPGPVLLAKCTRHEGAEAVFHSSAQGADVIARRSFGRGHVVFCGVTLGELFSAAGGAKKFFETLLHLPVLKSDALEGDSRSLFPNVVSAVAFNRRSGLYLMMVGFGSIGYVLLATFGSWALLGRRQLRRHAWSAFAIVGLAGTLVSVFAVNSARGFGGETLHQVSVVDARAGEPYGLATVYFGLKTAIDKRLDLWLPGDPLSASEPEPSNSFIRPLPVAANVLTESAETFTDPVAYRLVPGSGELRDVRIRGTLKRLEGRWEGAIGGTVRGEITIRDGDSRSRILPGSFLVNELGFDLRNGYLIHTARGFADSTGYRSEFIYAFSIGDVADGARLDLVERCYRPRDNEEMEKFLVRSTLAEGQKKWGSGITSLIRNANFGLMQESAVLLGEERNALLLLSTVGELDPAQSMSSLSLGFGMPVTWSRDRARHLDLRPHLRPETVLLVGFADDPGPARLFRRSGEDPYRPLAPDPQRSWTMYRIRIPAVVLPGRGARDEDDSLQ